MTCKMALELVEPIASGDLEPDAAARAHFESCPQCAAALATARQREAVLAGRAAPAAPERFTSSVLQRIRRERWRAEQHVDRLFNVAIAVALVLITSGILALMNMSGLMTQLRAVAEVADGRPAGIRLFQIKEDSIFHRPGLQDGDVVQRVNGTTLDDPTSLLTLLGRLRNQPHRGHTGERLRIEPEEAALRREKTGQLLQLRTAKRRIDVRHTVVVANLVVRVFPAVGYFGRGRQMLGAPGQFRVVGQDGAPPSGGDGLVAVEAQRPHQPEGAGVAAVDGAAE